MPQLLLRRQNLASADWTESMRRLQHDALPEPIADPAIATAEAAKASMGVEFIDIEGSHTRLVNKTFFYKQNFGNGWSIPSPKVR